MLFITSHAITITVIVNKDIKGNICMNSNFIIIACGKTFVKQSGHAHSIAASVICIQDGITIIIFVPVFEPSE